MITHKNETIIMNRRNSYFYVLPVVLGISVIIILFKCNSNMSARMKKQKMRTHIFSKQENYLLTKNEENEEK